MDNKKLLDLINKEMEAKGSIVLEEYREKVSTSLFFHNMVTPFLPYNSDEIVQDIDSYKIDVEEILKSYDLDEKTLPIVKEHCLQVENLSLKSVKNMVTKINDLASETSRQAYGLVAGAGAIFTMPIAYATDSNIFTSMIGGAIVGVIMEKISGRPLMSYLAAKKVDSLTEPYRELKELSHDKTLSKLEKLVDNN